MSILPSTVKVIALVLLAGMLPVRAAAQYDVSINCGGAKTFVGSHVYEKDVVYPGTMGIGHVDAVGTSFTKASPRIEGPADWDLVCRTARVTSGTLEYRFDVPPGEYLVTLLCADLIGHSDIANRFQVALEGAVVEPAIAPHFPNRRRYSSSRSWEVAVTDGTLDFAVTPLSDFLAPFELAQVGAIRVQTAPPAAMPTDVTGFELVETYRGIALGWDEDLDPRVHGYELQRSSDGEPFVGVTTGTLHAGRWMDDLLGQLTGLQEYRVRKLYADLTAGPWSEPIAGTPVPIAYSTLPYYQVYISEFYQLIHALFLQLSPEFKFYWPANMKADGVTYGDIKARHRGSASLVNPKEGWKLNFKGSQPFEGEDKLNLNGVYMDASMMRDRLSMSMWPIMGQPAPVVQPVNMSMNLEHMGVYQRVEQVDEIFLERRGLSAFGVLYKCGAGMFPEPDQVSYELSYEQDIPDLDDAPYDNALVDLIEQIDTIADEEVPDFIADHFDVENLVTYFAINSVICNLDHTTQNYYFYRPNNGKWMIIPWDMDVTWGVFNSESALIWDASLLFGVDGDAYTPEARVNALLTRFMGHDELRTYYSQRIAEVVEQAFDWPLVAPRFEAYRADVEPEGRLDPWKYLKQDSTLFDLAPSVLQAFHGLRMQFITEHASTLEPFVTIDDMRLNELLVLNTDDLIDESGDNEPWIEIRNDRPVPRSLLGWSLREASGDSSPFVFPDLRVPAHGTVIVWADGETWEGPLHAPFTLSETGGTVELSFDDGGGPIVMDAFTYGSQAADVSMGRHPDGDGAWQVMPITTPGGPNCPDATLPRLFINEFLASNESINVDEAGENEDWVELYNPGPEDVELGGLFVTDDLDSPFKWPLRDVTLPAGGFYLLWCDEDLLQGADHANFKLSASGEALGLFHSTGKRIDGYIFGPQLDDVSRARIVDGGTTWIFDIAPTPGATNNGGPPPPPTS